MPTLIERQHVVGVSHGLAKSIPGVGIALKTVQEHERRITWSPPLHVVQLQPIDGDKLILSKGDHTHSRLLLLAPWQLAVDANDMVHFSIAAFSLYQHRS